MNAVTRWKTIATIAIAFSAGNLFSAACQNAGSGKANAEDDSTTDSTTEGDDDATPPPAGSGAGRSVLLLAATLEGSRCVDTPEAGEVSDARICDCPAGFTKVGLSDPDSWHIACLED